MVLCYCLTVISVIAYFWRDRRGHSVLEVLIAPLIGAFGIGLSLYLILANFNLLSGYTGAVNLAFILPVPAVLLVGVLIAYRIKITQPQRYELIAQNMMDVNVCAFDEIEECESGA